jgi:predicted short-subunit dehydrogenase-like oxidoreductase (DUF2520 family)
MTLIANIIGAGNLGKTLGFLLKRHGIQIGGVCNTSIESTINAIDFIGAGYHSENIHELPPADMTFITTPDSIIQSVCNELSKTSNLKKGSIIIHCSGALTSDILHAVKNRNCFVASVHPMRSFASPRISVEQYEGTYCAIEGDAETIPQVESVFNLIGSVTYKICKEKKTSYHAAGIFASNYLVTLSQQALLCLEEAGVDKEIGMHVITNIMKGTIANLERTLSPSASLTGPIQRGDVSTIKKHLDGFQSVQQKELYSKLGLATIPLASLDIENKIKLAEMLQ